MVCWCLVYVIVFRWVCWRCLLVMYELVSPVYKGGMVRKKIETVAPDGENGAFFSAGAFAGDPDNDPTANDFLARRGSLGGLSDERSIWLGLTEGMDHDGDSWSDRSGGDDRVYDYRYR